MELKISENDDLGFELFTKSYTFLLEETVFTYFQLTPSLIVDLQKVYDQLVKQEIYPVQFLVWVFNQRTFVKPKDLLNYLSGFRYVSDQDPLDHFRSKIDEVISSMAVWGFSRLQYYMMYEPDPRLVVFDPDIRYALQTRKVLDLRDAYLEQLYAMSVLINHTKITLGILKERWIPFLYMRLDASTICSRISEEDTQISD